MAKIKTVHGTEERKVVSQKEWLAARLELLKAEKELTRRNDELAERRQQLPWVRIDKEYRFETDEGKASLADLFRGRSQLLIYHFMFGPDYTAGCPSCSAIADGFNGIAVHLANHDVMLWAVSQAPLAKLQAYKRRMGWTFPWASSADGAFNSDFSASFTEEEQRKGIEYNYKREEPVAPISTRSTSDGAGKFAAMCGTDVNTYIRERPGMSAFALEDGVVYHTYSTYARGLDGLWGMYQWLDRAPRDATRSASGGTATTSTKASRFGVKASQKTAALERWEGGRAISSVVTALVCHGDRAPLLQCCSRLAPSRLTDRIGGGAVPFRTRKRLVSHSSHLSSRQARMKTVSKPFAAIFWGGLLAGIFDITQAFIGFSLMGSTPFRILQSIARGIFGVRSREMGWTSAAIGLLCHFTVAFTAAAVYYLASKKLRVLVERPVLSGLVYGELVFLFMYFVVIPLSAIGPTHFNIATYITGPVGHPLLVGLPIALAVRRYSA